MTTLALCISALTVIFDNNILSFFVFKKIANELWDSMKIALTKYERFFGTSHKNAPTIFVALTKQNS